MSWQEILRQRLVDRNIRESSHAAVIEQRTFQGFLFPSKFAKSRNQIGDSLNIPDC